uniref:RNA-directed RNA polymerase n=1 Tax=Heterorhabditis bacteriophora TaxID=37862 RepID=A0A1I7XIC2_HETBA
MKVEQRYPDANMLFDTVGNDQNARACFVRFTLKVAFLMTRRQSPDSSIMTYLCGARHYKCAKLPKWIVSSSNFFMGNRNITPVMIQNLGVPGQTTTAESYCREIEEMHRKLVQMDPALINRNGSISSAIMQGLMWRK